MFEIDEKKLLHFGDGAGVADGKKMAQNRNKLLPIEFEKHSTYSFGQLCICIEAQIVVIR